MIGSSLNPNHPLPMVRLESIHGGGKTDLSRQRERLGKIRAAVQEIFKDLNCALRQNEWIGSF
jgi:hypothetical protein